MDNGMTLDQLEAGVADMNGVRADNGVPADVAAGASMMPEQEVRRAEPVAAAKGVHWDLQPIKQIASLYASGNTEEANRMRDEYRNASSVNAYVYDNLRGKKRVTAQYAAGLADSFRQMQDRIALQQADPVRQASAQAKEMANQEAMQKRAGVLDEISQTRNMITEMLEHPGFSGSVGMKNASYLFGLKEEPIAGTNEADFYPYIKQIRGGAFLKAFERIKGGGQITEIEGEKATDAIIRAQTSQSEEGFRKSMNDFLEVINSVEKRMLQSGQGGQAASPASGPAASAPVQPRNTFVYDGATYERLPDGTARLIE